MMYCSLQVRYLASRWFAFYTDICSKCDCFGGVVLGNSSYLLCSLRKNLWEKLSSCFHEKDKFSSFASNYQSLSLKINFFFFGTTSQSWAHYPCLSSIQSRIHELKFSSHKPTKHLHFGELWWRPAGPCASLGKVDQARKKRKLKRLPKKRGAGCQSTKRKENVMDGNPAPPFSYILFSPCPAQMVKSAGWRFKYLIFVNFATPSHYLDLWKYTQKCVTS